MDTYAQRAFLIDHCDLNTDLMNHTASKHGGLAFTQEFFLLRLDFNLNLGFCHLDDHFADMLLALLIFISSTEVLELEHRQLELEHLVDDGLQFRRAYHILESAIHEVVLIRNGHKN